MENYLAFIMCVALFAILADGLTSRYPNMQRQLYKVFFCLIYFLFLIRYYYGPDIWNYVHHYEHIISPIELWHHPEWAYYEWGYDMFCCLLNAIGVSYWGVTAVITTLYFAALACLFHSLHKYRATVLASVILLDYNLIYAENRQCLAVALFIFMILCLQKEHYLSAVILSILVVLSHKSGFLPVGLTFMGMILHKQRQSALLYNILIFVLIGAMLIPVTRVASPLLNVLPLPESYISSMGHHLQLGRQFQIVGLIYLAILVFISIWNAHNHKTYSWIAIEVLIGVVIIVALYQYYFFLNRMRSYFVPFIIYYLALHTSDSNREEHIPYMALLRQGIVALFFVYSAYGTFRYAQACKAMHAPIAKASTLFDLRHHSPKQIRDRQMKIAYQYWKEDYMKSSQNKL